MNKKLILILATLFTLVVPQVAHAGCQALGEQVDYRSTTKIFAFGGMYCTTNNGSHYQVRAYIQTNEGGSFHIATPAYSADYYNPGNLIYEAFYGYWTCVHFADNPGATQWRTKFVVENMVTHSIDPDYGEASSFRC